MKIELTKNQWAVVDSEDYEMLSNYSWIAANCPTNTKYYAQTTVAKKTLKMHRLIMNCPKGLQVDHINGDTLDNRKCNLRIVSPSQNAKNRSTQKSSRTGYAGVSKCNKKYRARITVDGKTLNLGLYDTAEEASEVYNNRAKLLFKEFARAK